MSSRVRGLCRAIAFSFAATFLAGGISQAQRTTKGDAAVRVLDLKGNPIPSGLMRIRDSEGRVLVPEGQEPEARKQVPPVESKEMLEPGVLEFRNVGRKLVLEFALRGPKARSIEIDLLDAPRVFVTVRVDPFTAHVKEVLQKPITPEIAHTDRIRGFPGRGQGRLVPPGNDSCATPFGIVDGATAFTNEEATTDGIAPGCSGASNIHNDVWFDYVATRTGVVTVETCGAATFDTKIAIYSGLTCPTGAPIACNDDFIGCTGFTSRATAPVIAGMHYLVRVGGFSAGTPAGTGTITITPPALPGDFDACATAPEVGCNGTTMFNNSGGTTVAGDPAFNCRVGGAAQGFGTSWFRFTATGTMATLDTNGSATGLDTLLAVYAGTCGALVEIGCDDDGGTDRFSMVTVSGLTIGQSYYIQVAGYASRDVGANTLNVSCSPPPGDDCGDPLVGTCDSLVTVNLASMSTDPTDPTFSCRFGGAGRGVGTAWITFVATDDSVRIHTNESLTASDTLLALYDGNCGALVELSCSEDDGLELFSELCYEGLTVGNTYYIQVASYDSFSLGEATVRITCPCIPPQAPVNDNCLTASALGPLPASVDFETTLATDDIPAGMSCGFLTGPFRNVWYSVTGTGNTITATTCNIGTSPNLDTKISVFCRDCTDRVCVAGNNNDAGPCGISGGFSTVSWCSELGVTYLVTVGAQGGSLGLGTVQLDVTDNGVPCTGAVQCEIQTMGACCLPDGSCVMVTEGDCALLVGGLYRGDGTECFVSAVTDGGFEDGMFSGNWTESSTNFGTPVCDGACGFGGGTGPRTGTHWAWFGGIPGLEEGSLEQLVTIPIGATSLDFYLEIPASSGNGTDFMEVTLDGDRVYVTLESAGPFVGYQLVSVPLGGFADGGNHLLEFHSLCTGLTNFFVDDISINSDVATCPQPGACCLPGGGCVVVMAGDCATQGGTYQGDGTACLGNAVTEGGFEDGIFGPAWAGSSTNFFTPVCDGACGFGGGTGPRTGTFWAWFGGLNAFEEGAVQQVVTIPAGATTLDFYLEIPITSGNGTDFLEVTIDGFQVFEVLESDGPFVGYQLVSIPLGAFADGGNHSLEFHSICTALTNFFVDDVSISSCN